PISLPENISDAEEWNYKPVKVSGTFLNDQSIFLQGKRHQDQLGYHLITPLKLPRGTLMFINRGWVPLGRKETDFNIAGRVTVDGIARHMLEPGLFAPNNIPAKNQWYCADLPALARGKPYLPLMVEAVKSGDTPPVGGVTGVNL